MLKHGLVNSHAHIRRLDRLVYAIKRQTTKRAGQLIYQIQVNIRVRRFKVDKHRLRFNIAQRKAVLI